MFEKFPSLLGFQPRFYAGGAIGLHLPFLYDAVALTQPQTIVTLGFGDGQAHLTFCQAAQENGLAVRAVAARRGGGDEADDAAWNEAKLEAQRLPPDLVEFRTEAPLELAATFADGSVDLLLVDDCDSGDEVRRELACWESKLAPGALILFHGTQLERSDSPRSAWQEWTNGRPTAELTAGIGLGIARRSATEEQPELLQKLFGNDAAAADIDGLYRLAHRKMEAEVRAARGERGWAALSVQKAWISSLMGMGMEAQRVMDHQSDIIRHLEGESQHKSAQIAQAEKAIAEGKERFEALHRDRSKAQLIMDAQAEQLQTWVATTERLQAERDKLKAQVKSQKQILQAAKAACRKGGKCFREVVPKGPKMRRPLQERVLRELERWPRNFRRLWAAPPAAPARREKTSAPTVAQAEPVEDRYGVWIREHEPNHAALEEQRRSSASWQDGPKISLLLPVLDPPADFLEAMLASIEGQTYGRWELCLVDAGSKKPETIEALARCEKRDARVRLERLPENLGIAGNTNRGFGLATGDFIVCVDHDDLLPPFALSEIADAIRDRPGGEIFYSDEDRLNGDGVRHSPFFKPEWSPALLSSSMYLGHLTAYRRELVEELGGWRKEFDLSQDYDFALRATDRPRVIVHIPKVLYHWREHAASGSAGGKPDARQTNLAALADAMRRRNLPAQIIAYPTANRARLEFARMPRVSIIIPTDSPTRARHCLEQLTATVQYPDYEVVFVTNSALAERLRQAAPLEAPVRFVAYDKPFNFSEKCNAGAEAATGERFIFYNDDVETEQRDWIENLIEPLENPEVGAVSPKLLYRSGRIQHAGLVTGVRGLVGTAFHQQPEDTTMHTNLAQSLREVSALSGACLALRRDDFFRCGGWDAVHTPIAASDLDLCFKLREAGLRCLYTPFTTLRHAGHESIGDETAKTDELAPRDKSSIYLLRRWGAYSTHDPYFTENMRDWLYADSPTPIRMWSPPGVATGERGDLLFVSHDLTLSGAPLILWQVAKWCRAAGFFVVVMAPEDGPMREKFQTAEIPLIVDPLVMKEHESFVDFARGFDVVIASTIFGAPVVHAAKAGGIPHLWWIHEGRVAEEYLAESARMRSALALADVVVTPDTRSAHIYQPFRTDPVRVLSYGIPDPREGVAPAAREENGPVRFLLLGSVEHRKGQLVLLEALRKLPASVASGMAFDIVGRPHDPAIAEQVRAAARKLPHLTYREGVSHDEALRLIAGTDVMVSCSLDETGPIILIEALALGVPILSTNVGAVAEKLADGGGALFVRAGDAEALASALERFVTEPHLRQRLAAEARGAYEQHFTYDRFGEGFVELVRELISSRAAPLQRRAEQGSVVVS
ncbi:MAG: glycosyltransferase [Chthoniobacterales bacterium]|nr:glycosyltransferase [Chthoniobacterales bacterium]